MTGRPARGRLDGGFGRRGDLAAGGPRRGRQPGDQRSEEAAPARRAWAGRRAAADAFHGLGPRQRERLVLRHVDRDPQRGLRAALADPDLEQPQPAVLDRELDVAHVGVVALEPVGVAAQLTGDGGHALVEDRDRLGGMGAGDDVLALGVEHDVAIQRSLTGRRVAREQHAGPRVRPRLPKTIAWTTTPVPRSSGIPSFARYARARSPFHDRKTASIACRSWAHGSSGTSAPTVWRNIASSRGRHAAANAPVVVRREAEVEDRVHHPGHRHRRARTNADEQRIRGVAEAAPDGRSIAAMPARISSSRPSGQPPARYARQASVEIAKPGGTGRPRSRAITPRLAALPPTSDASRASTSANTRRSRRDLLLECPPDAFRGERQVPDHDAGRVADGGGDRRRDAQQRALAHALRAVRPGPVGVLDRRRSSSRAAGPCSSGCGSRSRRGSAAAPCRRRCSAPSACGRGP